MPSTVETGASVGSILRTPWPSEMAYCCQPKKPSTTSPGRNCGFSDAITFPTAPPHHFADLDWRRVGLNVVHAAAHVGIDRNIEHTHQNLSHFRRWHGRFDHP